MDERHVLIMLPRRADVVVVVPPSDGHPEERTEVRTPVIVQMGDPGNNGNGGPTPKVVITITYEVRNLKLF
jgi:hypothetical protein